MFEQYANLLREKYPDISILGDNYPPPDWKLWLAQSLGAVKLAVMVLVLANINAWEWLGQQTPSWWSWLTSNKIYACMMLFFLGNAIEGQLVSTGAFEISFNDVPVWSKLETGRIPQPPELFQIIDNHVRFNHNTNSWTDNI